MQEETEVKAAKPAAPFVIDPKNPMAPFADAIPTPPAVGDLVEGTIIAMARGRMYIDLPPFGTGLIYGREYLNAADVLRKANPGDTITAKVVDPAGRDGYIELSLKEARQAAIWGEAEVAIASGTIYNLTVEDAKRWGGGFYIQQEHRLTGDLTLIGGVQANKIGSLAWNVVPRGGILWNPAEHFTMKALYGGAFRAPSLDESGLTHPGLTGNPKLVPEKVGTLDLQLSYQNNRVQASVDYFHSRETQLIFEDGSTRPALYYNLNAPATFQGVDSEGKYYILRNWFVMGSVLYQANHDQTIANLSPIPSLGAKAGISYIAESGASVSLFDAYQGHIGGYAASINPRPEAFHSVSVHARFDLTKHWLKSSAQGFALFVHGDDLANNQIWLPALGTNSANTIPVVRGRTIYFGIEVWQKQ